MDLLSALKRKKQVSPDAADGVRLARTRARQRLIGAAVLVVAGIIGFPLLFETQPRPIPVDLPIEIPRKDSAPSIVLPAPPTPSGKAESPPMAKSDRVGEGVINETSADAGRELTPVGRPASAMADQVVPSAVVTRTPERSPTDAKPKAQAAAAPSAAATPKQVDTTADDGARAKSLLEGKSLDSGQPPSMVAGAPRFVVQVGAFADVAAVKATRAKVERLGLATYTQVAETPAGTRTRVRAGPFATRAEAERAAARIKAADLPTVILAL